MSESASEKEEKYARRTASSGLGTHCVARQEVEELASGFGNDLGPAEGPLWWHDGGYLVFSDIGNNRRMKWAPEAGISVVQEPTNGANGLTRDRQGWLVACEGNARRVTRIEPDGSVTVMANNYHGQRLNEPNDVVVKSDGSIYFTDPGLGRVESELDFCGVYRVSPDRDSMHLLVRDLCLPNGLCFSQTRASSTSMTPPPTYSSL